MSIHANEFDMFDTRFSDAVMSDFRPQDVSVVFIERITSQVSPQMCNLMHEQNTHRNVHTLLRTIALHAVIRLSFE